MKDNIKETQSSSSNSESVSLENSVLPPNAEWVDPVCIPYILNPKGY